MTIDVNHYLNLKSEFLRVTKRILKRDLTSNKEKHIEYLTDLAKTYNEIISYIASGYSVLDQETKESYRNEWIYLRDKILRCYGRLNLTVDVPKTSLEQIEIELLLEKFNDSNTAASETNSERSVSPSLSDIDNLFVENLNNPNRDTLDNKVNMPNDRISRLEFMRLASSTINKNYEGDPLGLKAFVNSVNLLKNFVDDNLEDLFLDFVKSKLSGKAEEKVPQTARSVDEIIQALQDGVKPDNSKVISGRLLALKMDRNKLTDFSEQARELAEALQRSLIIEGIPQNKAKEMTIDKTIELCRNASRADVVKAVLGATKFDSPEEVVSKFITETSVNDTEKQILAYKTYQKQNKNKFSNNNSQNGNNRGRNNNYRGRKKYYNSNNNGQRNNNYQNNNQSNNNRGRRTYNNGYRGNNNDERNVRYTENLQAPQVQLGDAQNSLNQNLS